MSNEILITLPLRKQSMWLFIFVMFLILLLYDRKQCLFSVKYDILLRLNIYQVLLYIFLND